MLRTFLLALLGVLCWIAGFVWQRLYHSYQHSLGRMFVPETVLPAELLSMTGMSLLAVAAIFGIPGLWARVRQDAQAKTFLDRQDR
jgi:hypothetical protein